MPVVKKEQPKRGLTKEASQVFYNQMMIVLSGVEAGEPYGEIVHWYLETPVPYFPSGGDCPAAAGSGGGFGFSVFTRKNRDKRPDLAGGILQNGFFIGTDNG